MSAGAGFSSAPSLPAVPEDGVFQQLSRGRPVRGLQLQAAQGHVPQARGQVGGDAWSRGGAGDLRISENLSV